MSRVFAVFTSWGELYSNSLILIGSMLDIEERCVLDSQAIAMRLEINIFLAFQSPNQLLSVNWIHDSSWREVVFSLQMQWLTYFSRPCRCAWFPHSQFLAHVESNRDVCARDSQSDSKITCHRNHCLSWTHGLNLDVLNIVARLDMWMFFIIQTTELFVVVDLIHAMS